MKHLIYYGQNREDLVLLAFFPENRNGYYVDIGACDPIKFSVTKMFYDKGWCGINVEPQEKVYQKLCKDRKRDINLNIGISDKAGKLKIREYKNESLSTFSSNFKKNYEHSDLHPGLEYIDKEIEMKTLKTIFDENNIKKIQFLKVDVEGFELEVLRGNDWVKYRPEVLCIESNNMLDSQPWNRLVTEAGYKKVFFDGLNDYYVASEKKDLANSFKVNYQKFIVSTPALSFDWDLTFGKVVKQLEKVQKSLDSHVTENTALKNEIKIINKKNNNSFKVRTLFKKSLNKLKNLK